MPNQPPGLEFLNDLESDTQVKLGVGIIPVAPDGTLLLERRADCGMWGLLGGRLDPGESLRECIRRELHEESGLRLSNVELVGIYSGPANRLIRYRDKGDTKHLVDVIVAGRIRGTRKPRISEESMELRFFSKASLPSARQLIPPARKVLRDYVEGRRHLIA